MSEMLLLEFLVIGIRRILISFFLCCLHWLARRNMLGGLMSLAGPSILDNLLLFSVSFTGNTFYRFCIGCSCSIMACQHIYLSFV